MKSEENHASIKINDKSNSNKTITQNNFFKNKTIAIKNNPKYLTVLNNPILKKFNYQKTDNKLKSNSTKKNQFPLLKFNTLSFYDSLPSENSNNLDIEYLKNKLISNKSKINKKKTELQELKIQYNKLIDENKNHKNLIYEF